MASSPGLRILMLKCRLQAIDDCRLLAETLHRRLGRIYTDEMHEARRRKVLDEIAELRLLDDGGEYP